jgi:L-rhamnose mutarotase
MFQIQFEWSSVEPFTEAGLFRLWMLFWNTYLDILTVALAIYKYSRYKFHYLPEPKSITMSTPQRRFAQTIRIKPAHLTEYIRIHNPIPTAIATQIKKCNISNYSIFFDGQDRLFATFTYSGTDFETDMEAMRSDPATLKWWAVTDAMQESCNEGSTGSTDRKVPWWRECREVFRLE